MTDPPRYEYTGQRRFYLILGVAALFLGVALVAFAAYAFLFAPAPAGQVAYVIPGRASPVALGAVQAPASPLAGQKYNIVIEKAGVDAPVGVFGLDDKGVPEVPFDAHVVAWYNFSAEPGAGSNAVFAGHRTWRGDAVFRHLEDLAPGDRIVLRGEAGAEMAYEVFDTQLVDPDDKTAVSWMMPTDFEVITLITCGGEYRRTDDPVFGAEYDKRHVVRAAPVRDQAAGAGG